MHILENLENKEEIINHLQPHHSERIYVFHMYVYVFILSTYPLISMSLYAEIFPLIGINIILCITYL